jgi:hypothetical protein
MTFRVPHKSAAIQHTKTEQPPLHRLSYSSIAVLYFVTDSVGAASIT